MAAAMGCPTFLLLKPSSSSAMAACPKPYGSSCFHNPSSPTCNKTRALALTLAIASSGSSFDPPPRQKSKGGRNVRTSRSNETFAKELHQFILSAGLPPNEVPSTKELTSRGRDDLARVVKRRGYRAVAQLLQNIGTVENNKEEIEKEKEPTQPPIIDTHESTQDLSEQENQIKSTNGSARLDWSDLRNDVEFQADEPAVIQDDPSEVVQSLLRERAAHFVQTGKLDFEGSDDESAGEEDEEADSHDSISEGEFWDTPSSDGVSLEDLAIKKAEKLRSRLLPFFAENNPTDENLSQSEGLLLNILSKQEEIEKLHKHDLEIQSTSGTETQREIEHIKSILRTRELELAELSRKLEEAKAQLSLAQAKSAAELAQAKQIALEKEASLQAANQALTNLKRVQVEYWGEGSVVEITGSFNGWHSRVAMESDPASEIPNPDGSRGPMMWAVELWLYPGIYEIKFVVDGIWVVDPRREVIMRNLHQNNVLRVDSSSPPPSSS